MLVKYERQRHFKYLTDIDTINNIFLKGCMKTFNNSRIRELEDEVRRLNTNLSSVLKFVCDKEKHHEDKDRELGGDLLSRFMKFAYTTVREFIEQGLRRN
jgi:hypothetical protein